MIDLSTKIKCVGVNDIVLKKKNWISKSTYKCQTLLWEPGLAVVLQGSNVRLLFFLIYINDLSKSLSSNTKLFDDDKSIFFAVKNMNVSTD